MAHEGGEGGMGEGERGGGGGLAVGEVRALEDAALDEGLIGLELVEEADAFVEVVGGDEEEGGFEGGEESAVGTASEAAELGEAALEVGVFDEEEVEGLGAEGGREGEEDDGAEGPVGVEGEEGGVEGCAWVEGRGRWEVEVGGGFGGEVMAEAFLDEGAEPGEVGFEGLGDGLGI